jgi:hypothetical protein
VLLTIQDLSFLVRDRIITGFMETATDSQSILRKLDEIANMLTDERSSGNRAAHQNGLGTSS